MPLDLIFQYCGYNGTIFPSFEEEYLNISNSKKAKSLRFLSSVQPEIEKIMKQNEKHIQSLKLKALTDFFKKEPFKIIKIKREERA